MDGMYMRARSHLAQNSLLVQTPSYAVSPALSLSLLLLSLSKNTSLSIFRQKTGMARRQPEAPGRFFDMLVATA